MDPKSRATLVTVVFLAAWAATALTSLAFERGGGETDPSFEPNTGAFIHAVYFWLRNDLTSAQRDALVRGLESLRDIETVQHGWIGVPAPTDRPIIERSYSYALTLVFADEAGHDAYQVHPVHDRFREEFGDFWTQVLIYDSVQ